MSDVILYKGNFKIPAEEAKKIDAAAERAKLKRRIDPYET
jgi:hypothetical protein